VRHHESYRYEDVITLAEWLQLADRQIANLADHN
jgi:hypothetical protein